MQPDVLDRKSAGHAQAAHEHVVGRPRADAADAGDAFSMAVQSGSASSPSLESAPSAINRAVPMTYSAFRPVNCSSLSSADRCRRCARAEGTTDTVPFQSRALPSFDEALCFERVGEGRQVDRWPMTPSRALEQIRDADDAEAAEPLGDRGQHVSRLDQLEERARPGHVERIANVSDDVVFDCLGLRFRQHRAGDYGRIAVPEGGQGAMRTPCRRCEQPRHDRVVDAVQASLGIVRDSRHMREAERFRAG